MFDDLVRRGTGIPDLSSELGFAMVNVPNDVFK